MNTPDSKFQLKFIKYIQWLLDAGSYTSTYKFALLMSLVNTAIESGVQDDSCYFVSYQQLAEHFIKLYWNQALPYHSDQTNEPVTLFQIGKGRRTAVVSAILELQSKHTNLNIIKAKYPQQYQQLKNKVARVIKQYPALHLQSPENTSNTFLYRYQPKAKGIELNPGVAFCLAHFSSIIYKLCQYYWTEYIRNNTNNQHLFNDKQDLHSFLFGQTRQALSLLLPLFVDIQKNSCFYCQKPFKNGTEVDHFIPWSKYPNDTAHNFVLADHQCNHAKRDYLAGMEFYEKWLTRNQQYGRDIHHYSVDNGFVSNQATSERVAQWAYQLAIENNDSVWIPPKKLIEIHHSTAIFASIQ